MSIDNIIDNVEGWVHDPASWLNSDAKDQLREILEGFAQESKIPPGTRFDLVIKGYHKGNGDPIMVGYADPLANVKADMEAAEAAAHEQIYITSTDKHAVVTDAIEGRTDIFELFTGDNFSVFSKPNMRPQLPVAVYSSRPSAQESYRKTLEELAYKFPAKQIVEENPISFEILYFRQVAGEFAKEVGQQFVDKLVTTIREVDPSCNHENLMSDFAHRITISEEGKGREKNKQVWLKEDPKKPSNSALNPATLLFEYGNRVDLRPFGNTLTFIFS